MLGNLHFLIKWCHGRGYTIRVGLRNCNIRYKLYTINVNIDELNNMNRKEFREYRNLITNEMEGK